MIKARKKQVTLLLLSALMLLMVAFPVNASTRTLSGDIGVHDPAYIVESGITWVFSTGQGIQVLYSSNGTTFSRGTQVFASEPSWWSTYVPNHTKLDVWAPDIYYYNGKYHLYYSISSFGSNTSAIGLVTCTSILKGDWVDQGVVVSSNSSSTYNAIDPNLFADKSGNLYMSFGSWFAGIYVTAIDKTTMKPTGNSYRVATKSGGIEGSSIIYNASTGYYYLFVSIGTCCAGTSSTYKVAVGRSTSVFGPYYAKDGTDMKNGGATVIDSGNTQWVGPGGQDVPSTSLIVRHAYDATDNGAPKLLISDLYWDSSGWPYYN
ncbi:arabinan endo-1,5-alpha-L-arabinosidase [Paenibacillus phyllosphaerae]|uniref:Endo-alpha-(1->5)-L-arabinanase n=1 Tax=Paenibacillus phyllosphaerae TaxID=274593 RepID=A0A7W5FNV0_9BACL|nr:glycoside hydrolase family 43 protein [Paenibacillus phyllosphaerae]MBB3111538.1 arabinan endo-1,5-alpha-L-arabinosidase [Paenibacillus phyllosphaerae]